MNELTIPLKNNSKTPLYEQIYQYIKLNIQSGHLSYGEKLPSTRALSKHLTVSRSTVELAYEQLLSEGYIESEPCRGFFVAQIEELYHLNKEKEVPQAPLKEKETYDFDFTPNGVDLNSFPYEVWRKLSREVLLDDRTELFKSGDPNMLFAVRFVIICIRQEEFCAVRSRLLWGQEVIIFLCFLACCLERSIGLRLKIRRTSRLIA